MSDLIQRIDNYITKSRVGLVPKKVDIHRAGKLFQGIRWVRPGKDLRTPSGLRIPPAWKDVWMSPDKSRALQAFGFDSKGRKQYIYSVKHTGKSSAAKFQRLKSFNKAYPSLIKRIEQDFNKNEEARVLYLISKTGFRIGSDKDTKASVKAFGASTIQCQHANVSGDYITFDFIGKKGVHIRKKIKDPKIASFMGMRCKRNKDGPIFDTSDSKVRDYLSWIPLGRKFEIKDFRLYIGTSIALREMKKMNIPDSEKQFKNARKEIAIKVSNVLGNSPAIALKSYISPEVFSSWEAKTKEFIKKSEDDYSSTIEDFLDSIMYDEEVPWEDEPIDNEDE